MSYLDASSPPITRPVPVGEIEREPEKSKRIDFVSDVTCPWCAIGVTALERALERVGDAVEVEVHFQPFELNPDMAPEGLALTTYLANKFGLQPAQIEAAHAMLEERGRAVGFTFGRRSKVWNTFDAHRLLYWADAEGPAGSQRQLKLGLMRAYHGEGRNPGALEVLLELAGEAGLDVVRARAVLESSDFSAQVREAERVWNQSGIHAVPTMIIDQTYTLQGAQPVEVIEKVLRDGI